MRRWPFVAAAAVAALLPAALAFLPGSATSQTQTAADNHPGKDVYEANCAFCHEEEENGAPSTEAIRRLSRANIKYTVELGYMRQYALHIPKADIEQMLDWMPLEKTGAATWTDKAMCQGDRRQVRLTNAPRYSTNFGFGLHNNRNVASRDAGLSKADMKNLELAWTIAFPQTATMRSQPVIVGDTLFIAATDSGHIYALDADTGCVKWSFASELTLRSSLAFAEPTGNSPAMIIAGDAGGFVHGLDATTGKRLWRTDIKLSDVNRITGAPMVHENRVYVPLSAIEVNYAGPDEYECCIGQGAVVALDIADGKSIWVGRTMEPPQPTFKDTKGVQKWGPSGAIIWSTPVIDPKRRLIYAGTGENTSWPATETSDAIIAYDMDTGEHKWVFQATKADIWNYACGRRGVNCTWPGEYQSPDHDFGGSPMLVKLKDGRELVVAGQKSGVVWAIDPDTGKLVWSNKVGQGSAGGGVRWGIAFDGDRILVPQNDPANASNVNPNWGPGIHALNAATGEIEWSYKPNGRDCGQDFPVAAATRPPAEQRMLAISAPVPVPVRENVQQASAPGRGGAQAAQAGRGGQQQAQAGRGGAPAGRAGPPMARCRVGMAAAPLVVDGAVVTGTNGGMLRIFDTATGEVLFEYQTNKTYPNTVNGVEGRGGSIDSHPYAVGNGTLFVQSGYARFGQPPGNMLLAFRPKGRTAGR